MWSATRCERPGRTGRTVGYGNGRRRCIWRIGGIDGSRCLRCSKWMWTRSAPGWTGGSGTVCAGYTTSPVRGGPGFTRRRKKPRCAAGWRRNPARSNGRRPGWNRRRASAPAGRRRIGSSKKAYRWKQCRRRVKGPRDEAAFRAAHARLKQLRQGHAREVIELFYFDQSGFALTPAIPYAWQRRGKTLALPSAASPRVNVLGFMSPTNQSHFRTVTGAVTSATVIAVLDAFAAQTARAGKLRLVVLDNASIHTRRAFQARVTDWFRQGTPCIGCHPTAPNSTSSKFSGAKLSTNGFHPGPISASLTSNPNFKTSSASSDQNTR